jgi:hypothetical protein
MKRSMMTGGAFLLLVFVGCVSLDQLPPGSIPAGLLAPSTATAAGYGDLDVGGTSMTATHFTLKGYSDYELRLVSQLAESLYNKIGSDTGLYSFLASENFTVVLYKDQEEYLRKTRQSNGSRIVSAGTSIYTYPGSDLEPAFAHELTHVIVRSYLGHNAAPLKWLTEGLAMVEELSRMTEADRSAYQASKSLQLRQERIPFSQMTFFVSKTEEKRHTDAWYQQVESVINYLLSQGSPLAFAQMMSELRSGVEIDRAISDAYPGKFRSLNDLEAAWKYTI